MTGFVLTLLAIYFVYKTPLQDDLDNKIQIEIIKSLLELLVVIIIGGIVSALFKAEETNREQSRIRVETWKDYIKRIGTVYRDVKRARRALTAGGLTTKNDNNPTAITKEQFKLYFDQMGIINNAQLELEGLKIEAKSLPDFILLSDISPYLENSEDYLRQILKEYEAALPALANEKTVEFISLERLHEFTTSVDDTFEYKRYTENIDYRFGKHFATPFDEILKIFNTAF